GKALKYGDDISTDHILPSRYMTEIEPQELAKHCMSGIDARFSSKVKEGDFLAAGENIGYGSSREQAPQALKNAGIRVIIAKSFARIFYRNCFNIGIPAVVCPNFITELNDEDMCTINLEAGSIYNETKDKYYNFAKPPDFMLEYIRLGGLIPYLEMQSNQSDRDSIEIKI
ncbi:MAG TPA: 3-isopropylmalate dehydratase, partial [Clostridiales bacterium]|nr:3-isopropylmalate dehydratase [Clostridiales bacterium]